VNLSLHYEKYYINKNKFVQVQTDDRHCGDQYTTQVRGQTAY